MTSWPSPKWRKPLNEAGVNNFTVKMPEYAQPAYTGKLYKQELYFPTWKIRC